jgi:myosin heavy subunit
MPIATNNKTFTVYETTSHQLSALHLSEPNNADDPFVFHPTDIGLLDEICDLIEQIEQCEKDESDAKKAVEQLDRAVRASEDVLSKAEEKKEALIKKNRLLESRLDERNRNIKTAVDYWREYGVDVKQFHQDGDPFEQYEMIFANLDRRRRHKKSTGSSQTTSEQHDNPGQDNPGQQQESDTTPASKHKQAACSVSLKYYDKRLEVVGQMPEILLNVSSLNEKLTHQCVNQANGHVNYKSAMALIRQELIRDSPLAKTSQHPPAETNSHTCTSPADPSSMS